MSRARDTADQINRVNSSAADATAITVDSSERVLIGKTSAGYNVDGFEAHPNGETYVSRSGTPMAINRNSSDGTLLNLYKDGSSVGSIGSSNTGERLYMVNDSTGLSFIGDFSNIFPCDSSGTARDNAINLGGVGGRFRNLYLSGGVFLGGTGTANKLSDYEEGTWTPTAVSNCTIPTIHNAGYTKVGNQVHLSFWIKTSNTASNIVLSGLPFEVTTNQRFTGAASDVLNLNNISTQILYLNLYFYNVPTGTNRDLMFGVSYKTNS